MSTKRVFLIGCLPAELETQEHYGVGKEIGDRVNGVCYERLAFPPNACYELQCDQEHVDNDTNERDRFTGFD